MLSSEMRKYKIIDTHTHYNDERYLSNIDHYFDLLEKDSIFVNIIGTELDDSLKAIELAKKFTNAKCSIGIHPSYYYEDLVSTIDKLENLIKQNQDQIIAIGECGLDYYYDTNPSEQYQKELMIAQIKLASKYNLPIIFHIRDAHDDAIEIIKQYRSMLSTIIIHCYTDNVEYAKKYVELDCFISFSGIITFKKSDELREVIKEIDINHILSETDSPYLSPEPYRGKLNTSNNVILVNEKIAEIKNISLDKINKILLNNAKVALKLTMIIGD